MESARIVMVGFCQPQVTKLAASTTKRFLMSWLWFQRFSTLVLGSSPMRQVPCSWMLRPGGKHRSVLERISQPQARNSSSRVSAASFAMFRSLPVL